VARIVLAVSLAVQGSRRTNREIPAKFLYPADCARFRHFPRSRRFHLRA
jgi:hypothetical protein